MQRLQMTSILQIAGFSLNLYEFTCNAFATLHLCANVLKL